MVPLNDWTLFLTSAVNADYRSLFSNSLSSVLCSLLLTFSRKKHIQNIYIHAHVRVCGWVYPHSQTLSHTALQLGPFSFYLCHFVSLSLSLPLCVSLSLWHFLSFFLSLFVNFLFIVFASSGFIIVHSSSCFKSPFCSFFLPWASIVVVSTFVFQRPLITCSSGLTQLKSFSTSSVRPRWKAHLASNPRLLHIDRDSKKNFRLLSHIFLFAFFLSVAYFSPLSRWTSLESRSERCPWCPFLCPSWPSPEKAAFQVHWDDWAWQFIACGWTG